MDFKVCGTRKGITSVQMDIKIQGLTREVLQRALKQARDGRLYILDKMAETIAAPNKEMSKYAPRIYRLHVKPDRVRDIIGPGGKMIRAIIEQTGVAIDIEDDGTVTSPRRTVLRRRRRSTSSRALPPSPRSAASTWAPSVASSSSAPSSRSCPAPMV
jgi:polyribonucleotide nucleotidyltransferase